MPNLRFALHGLDPLLFSEKRTGNIAKRRLLANPYGPEIQLNFAIFLGEKDLNSEKRGIYESPPDRYVPNSSPADFIHGLCAIFASYSRFMRLTPVSTAPFSGFKTTSSRVVSLSRASVDRGLARIRAEITSSGALPACIGFVPGGSADASSSGNAANNLTLGLLVDTSTNLTFLWATSSPSALIILLMEAPPPWWA